MLKYLVFLSALLFPLMVQSQKTTLAKQSFETTGDTWPVSFSTPPCTQNGDSWNYRTELGDIHPSDGDRFWGIRDLNGDCGSNGFETLEFDEISVSGYRNVQITFDFNVFEFDNADDLRYELILDGISQGEVLFFEGSKNLSTDGWITENISVPNTAQNVKFILSVKQNGDSDYAGLDNFILTGEPITPCSELMISEYVEGSSNNKYLELYNPSGQDIDLSAYNLTQFNGRNTMPTGNLSLTGTITSYGTYLIKNQKESLNVTADLSTGSILGFNGDDKIALRKGEKIIDLIGIIGDSLYYAKDVTLRRKSNAQSPNNEFDPAEWDVYGTDDISNLNKHVSVCSGNIPEIEVSGNAVTIIDGAVTSDVLNNTYFSAVKFKADTSVIKSFTIRNTGNDQLRITEIRIEGAQPDNFDLINNPATNIPPDDSINFTIRFKPKTLGLQTATVVIDNNDASESTYNFMIQGEGTGTTDSPLKITQYYESGANKLLEISNTTQVTVPEQYYLALYNNEKALNPQNHKPGVSRLIPELLPGQTIRFRASLNVTQPAYALDETTVPTTVCTFNGDDIIIISSTNDGDCWGNKVDIIGENTLWGEDISFIRKYGCKEVKANTGFDPEDWLKVPTDSVNNANSDDELYIGKHLSGTTTFISGIWNNGIPDSTRNAEIRDLYKTATQGSFETCNLTIGSDGILQIDPKDHISILHNLNINGILKVMNEASLLMKSDTATISSSGTTEIHRITTPMKKFDYTYWSSPVKHARLSEVFSDSPQNSFFTFNTSEFTDNDQDNADDDDPDVWKNESGEMTAGTGYTAMAPNNDNFSGRQAVIFQGEVNNGFIRVPVHTSNKDTVSGNNWNFIGNPYPSAIDVTRFLEDPQNNELLDGAIYFWTHTSALENNKYSSDDYASYVLGTGGIKACAEGTIPTGFIASCQGFFVNALKEGTVHFSNHMRVKDSNDNFFKEKKSKLKNNRIWLDLTNDEGAFSQILIGFIDGASEKIERKFDALRFDANTYISFYTFAENKRLGILGTSPFTGSEKILLGFRSAIEVPAKLKISIDQIKGDLKNRTVYLIDNLLKISHKLNDSAYEFKITNKGEFNERFVLQFEPASFDPDNTLISGNTIIVKDHPGDFTITLSDHSEIYSVIVYDMLGRTILKNETNSTTQVIGKNIFHSRGVFVLVVKPRDRMHLTTKLLLL